MKRFIFISLLFAGASFSSRCFASEITGFSLVTPSGTTFPVIAGFDPIPQNGILYLDEVPASIGVRANVSAFFDGSVDFNFDNGVYTRLESYGPFSLCGGSGAQISACPASPVLTPGVHTLKATAFSAKSGGGSNLGSTSVTFTIKKTRASSFPPGSLPISLESFGMDNRTPSDPWPNISNVPIGFGTLRLWDSGVTWSQIALKRPVDGTNPNDSAYQWAPLDSWLVLAQQHNVDVIYTLGSTPQWASSNSTLSNCNYHAGACAPPTNNQDLSNFIVALLKHNTSWRTSHGGGGIKFIEVWNEPNDFHFYQGTVAQLASMHISVFNAAASTDPSIKLLTPAPTYSTNPELGQTSPAAWMKSHYLPALKSKGGTNAFVAAAFHGYIGSANVTKPEGVLSPSWASGMRDALTSNGYASNFPIWLTEGSWGDGSNTAVAAMTSAEKAAFLARYYLGLFSAGVTRVTWYGWDFSPWGTLWSTSTGVSSAGIAYQQLSKWLVGSALGPCRNTADVTGTSDTTIYACKVYGDSSTSLIVWTTSTSRSFSPAGAASGNYGHTLTLDGSAPKVFSGAVTINNEPLLLEP